MKDNPILHKLFRVDQADRQRKNIDWNKVNERDKARQKKVFVMLAKKMIKTSVDFYRAAMIFQHSVELTGNKMAQKLAMKSMDMGENRAKWLYAASTDRVLMRQKKRQKFGTQYTQRCVAGKGDGVDIIFELYPYDKKTTDAERAKYNVPSLKKGKKIASTFN